MTSQVWGQLYYILLAVNTLLLWDSPPLEASYPTLGNYLYLGKTCFTLAPSSISLRPHRF